MDALRFDPNKVLVIAGPTSSGKSSLAMALADALPIDIVCMDAMQVYREPRIGTARPSPEDEARVPHHLFGSCSVRQPLTCMRFVSLASERLSTIQSAGRFPLLVGGTGLYMRALFEGMDPVPATPAPLRARLDRIAADRGPGWLYRMLEKLDPRGAARLHPNDRQRVQRFLEVRILTGESILELWGSKNKKNPVFPRAIGLEVPRELLNQRIEIKVRQMIQHGWIEETRSLAEAGVLSDVFRIGPIGYRTINEYLAQNVCYEKMIERIMIDTRRYAKRQMTWFRKVSYIRWFPFHTKTGYNVKEITNFLRDKMG